VHGVTTTLATDASAQPVDSFLRAAGPRANGARSARGLHLVVDAFGDDGVALVEVHFRVALFDRHPAFGGGVRVRRVSSAATGERCGGQDEHQRGDKIDGVWCR
jgi:hypothetical protein